MLTTKPVLFSLTFGLISSFIKVNNLAFSELLWRVNRHDIVVYKFSKAVMTIKAFIAQDDPRSQSWALKAWWICEERKGSQEDKCIKVMRPFSTVKLRFQRTQASSLKLPHPGHESEPAANVGIPTEDDLTVNKYWAIHFWRAKGSST